MKSELTNVVCLPYRLENVWAVVADGNRRNFSTVVNTKIVLDVCTLQWMFQRIPLPLNLQPHKCVLSWIQVDSVVYGTKTKFAMTWCCWHTVMCVSFPWAVQVVLWMAFIRCLFESIHCMVVIRVKHVLFCQNLIPTSGHSLQPSKASVTGSCTRTVFNSLRQWGKDGGVKLLGLKQPVLFTTWWSSWMVHAPKTALNIEIPSAHAAHMIHVFEVLWCSA